MKFVFENYVLKKIFPWRHQNLSLCGENRRPFMFYVFIKIPKSIEDETVACCRSVVWKIEWQVVDLCLWPLWVRIDIGENSPLTTPAIGNRGAVSLRMPNEINPLPYDIEFISSACGFYGEIFAKKKKKGKVTVKIICAIRHGLFSWTFPLWGKYFPILTTSW